MPKAGVFAESAGRAVAEHLIAQIRGGGLPKPYDGAGSCFIEFGEHKVGRVDADFLTGPSVTAPFYGPSLEKAEEKMGGRTPGEDGAEAAAPPSVHRPANASTRYRSWR